MIRLALVLIRNPALRSWYLNSSLHSCSCEVQQLKIIIIIIIIILVESNPYRDIPRYNIQQYFICLWFTYTYLAQKLDILYYILHTYRCMASAPARAGSVFMRRIEICLGQRSDTVYSILGGNGRE